MMDIGSDKKPLNRFDDKDREQANKLLGKGKWVEHICPDHDYNWAIHSKEFQHRNESL